jgi:hypothetical protein
MPKMLQELYFDYNSVVKHVHIDYCIRSDFLDPVQVTEELGIKPSRAWAKGERYLSKVYSPKSKTVKENWKQRPWGIWALETKNLATKDAEEHLVYLLNLLEPKKEVIRKYMADKEKHTVRFYIWWEPFDGHGSYAISNEILERAATLCHYIEFGFIFRELEGDVINMA